MTANPINHALQQYSVKTICGFSIPMDISQTKAAIPAHKKKRKTLYILLSLIPEKFKKSKLGIEFVKCEKSFKNMGC